MRHWPGWRWGIAMVLAASCRFDSNVAFDQTVVSCNSSTECPARSRCVISIRRCVALGVEMQPPRLLSATIDRAEGRARDTFTLQLVVDEGLSATPKATVDFSLGRGSGAFTFVEQPAASSYVFTYTATGEEPQGTARVSVELIDLHGNETKVLTDLTFELDFSAPSAVGATMSYLPSAGCFADPESIRAMSRSVQGTLTFTTNEPLAVTPELTADPPWLEFLPVGVENGVMHFDLRLLPDAPQDEGPVTLYVTLVDRAGNSSRAELPVSPPLIIDNRPPEPPRVDSPGDWTLWRVPNGEVSVDGGANVASFWVDVAADQVAAGHTIRLVDEHYLQPAALPVIATGHAARIALFPPDRQAVKAQLVDKACNSSEFRRIRDVRVIHRAIGQETPHHVETAPRTSASFLAKRSTEILDAPNQLAVAPLESLTIERHRYRAHRFLDSRLVYDGSRSRVVAFGGQDVLGISTNEMWEWNGSAWRQLDTAVAPPPRFTEGLAFDPLRNTIVLFGGFPDDNTLWEWRDGVWRDFATTGSGLVRHDRQTASFDGRGITFMPHEHQATSVRWDGRRLTRLPSGDEQARLARFNATTAAYDRKHGVVVLSGHDTVAPLRAQTFEWSVDAGFVFRRYDGIQSPTAVKQADYFEPREAVVRLNRTLVLEWVNAGWRPFTEVPTACQGDALAVDRARGEIVILPNDRGADGRTCVVRADGTVRIHSRPVVPEPRNLAAMTEVPGTSDVLLHGGQNAQGVRGDSWLYRDGGWAPLPTAAGPPAFDFDLVADSTGGLLLVGGRNELGQLPSTYVFRNNAWSVAGPAPTWGLGVRGTARLDGTILAVSPSGTWQWQGTGWAALGVGPPPLSAFRVATMPGTGRVLAYASRKAGVLEAEDEALLYELRNGAWRRVTTNWGLWRRETAPLVAHTFANGTSGLFSVAGLVYKKDTYRAPETGTMYWDEAGSVQVNQMYAFKIEDNAVYPLTFHSHAATYSSATKAHFVFSGSPDFSTHPPPLNPPAFNEGFLVRTDETPELVVRFDLSQSACGESDIEIQAVTLKGLAACDSVKGPGCLLEVFRNGAWRELATVGGAVPSGFEVPVPLEGSFELGRSLGVRVRSRGPSLYMRGKTVELYDLQTEVRYRLP